MKHALMPQEPIWWVWLATVGLLAVGLAGFTVGFITAIALSLAQTVFFWQKRGSLQAMSVQIRAAYTALLLLCLLPFMRWLYWLPTIGTLALTVFGYCLLARVLSLMPWNRHEPLTLELLHHTFLTGPVITWASQKSAACGGEDGVSDGAAARTISHAASHAQRKEE